MHTSKRAQFYLSRQALLDHIAGTELVLVKKVGEYKKNDPASQEQLLERYLEFQDDLARLKEMLAEPNREAELADGQKELGVLVNNFRRFLISSGFYQTN